MSFKPFHYHLQTAILKNVDDNQPNLDLILHATHPGEGFQARQDQGFVFWNVQLRTIEYNKTLHTVNDNDTPNESKKLASGEKVSSYLLPLDLAKLDGKDASLYLTLANMDTQPTFRFALQLRQAGKIIYSYGLKESIGMGPLAFDEETGTYTPEDTNDVKGYRWDIHLY